MILPILSYGHEMLRVSCHDVHQSDAGLPALIEDMWQTMYNAKGCGLAAPQVNKPLRLFVVDSKTTFEAMNEKERAFYFHEDDKGLVETFINATIIESSKDTWEDEEGCLSIPNLARPVTRPVTITISYYDRDFNQQTRVFSGTTARMIQHEYDHTCGILYLDYLKPLAKKLLTGKLKKIAAGLIPARYPMIYRRP